MKHPYSIIKNKVYYFNKVEEDKYELIGVAKFYLSPLKNKVKVLNLVPEEVLEEHIKELHDSIAYK